MGVRVGWLSVGGTAACVTCPDQQVEVNNSNLARERVSCNYNRVVTLVKLLRGRVRRVLILYRRWGTVAVIWCRHVRLEAVVIGWAL